MPETLISALTELEAAYKDIVADPSFKACHLYSIRRAALWLLLTSCFLLLVREATVKAATCFCYRHDTLIFLSASKPRILYSQKAVAQAEFAKILKDYVGRESPLYHAERLSEHYRQCAPHKLAGCTTQTRLWW